MRRREALMLFILQEGQNTPRRAPILPQSTSSRL